MGRLLEYFLVCGLGPDLQTTDIPPERGYFGSSVYYQPALLDQYPPSEIADCPDPPPQLPLCVLPGGVQLYSQGPSSQDPSSTPRSYPIVLTEGDGSKIYLSCIAFRDPVDDDVAQAYNIPANSYVDKCICFLSHSPCFELFRDALEEIYRCCFSAAGSSKPMWDIIAHVVMSVPLPSPGMGQILFSVDCYQLTVEAPPKDGLPHADMSFEPLVQSLDIENLIRLFTAVLLERRVLLRANKYSLLTVVAESIRHLIYPVQWQHVYIPVLFIAGVDYIDAPTPYLMGLHSSVDISFSTLDGVTVVDLDNNKVLCADELPELPEIEGRQLRKSLLQLVHPTLARLDLVHSTNTFLRRFSKPWCKDHDVELRLTFLQFFASVLSGYRDFVDSTVGTTNPFNAVAFLRKRSRIMGCSEEPMVTEWLSSQGFISFIESGYGKKEAGPNLVDKLQLAISRGEDRYSVLPAKENDPEVLTVPDSDGQVPVSRSRHCYDRFPAFLRTPAQDEKRMAILAAAVEQGRLGSSGAGGKAENLSPQERAAERDLMVLDIKVKLQGLWRRLVSLGPTDDPLSSAEYGTILALIESDAEGIGGSGFVECLREHIHSGWECDLTDLQFNAVKELMKTTISRAFSRNDMTTIRDSLEIASEIHRKDHASVTDYLQRHLGALPVWDEPRFWEGYFEHLMDMDSESKSGPYSSLVTEHLVVLAKHMAGLGMRDLKAWTILETIAKNDSPGVHNLIGLRGLLALMRYAGEGYWGLLPEQALQLHTQQQQQNIDQSVDDESNQPSSETAGIGRSWVHSMFSRDKNALNQTGGSGRSRGSQPVLERSDSSRNMQASTPEPGSGAGAKRGSSGVRLLRGHKAAVTALHAGTRQEMGDCMGDYEDTGYFISGSADCTIKIWNPRLRGSELQATFIGHTRPIRAISSDKIRVVSGSDDNRVLVWDKNSKQLQQELKGHDGKVNIVRMLKGERILSASHDGSVKMWDIRIDSCVATVGKSPSPILCMDYDDNTGMLAAAGVDGVGNVWDVRAGKQMHKLIGHSSWIRSLRMVENTIVTGSDDWTARVWSVSSGACETVLACHSGAVTNVEYCPADKGIVTGSADGLVRIWEQGEGNSLRCVSNLEGVHAGGILSIKAGDRWLAVGASDNTMSLFHRPERQGGSRLPPWKLLRTPPRSAAVVRCVASDVERGRICSGARNGLLRLWEPVVGY
ncbi:hypothetical protein KC19_4G271700 [Ceratodon purpureus]|uniref:UDENN domain-containing protein n=1 Tax=Ceratodon purpureus TaxID=3225 RepID=A0A8T0ID50_CERPU|nr:hypothetical protein KC19_4G271700 [Ceratodon purpureus]